MAVRDALEGRVMDDDSGSGSGIEQRWMMTTTMTATAVVNEDR